MAVAVLTVRAAFLHSLISFFHLIVPKLCHGKLKVLTTCTHMFLQMVFKLACTHHCFLSF